MNNYAVMISEEDGDVDMDLPRKINLTRPFWCKWYYISSPFPHSALEKDDHIAKFRFRYLGIVEVSS